MSTDGTLGDVSTGAQIGSKVERIFVLVARTVVGTVEDAPDSDGGRKVESWNDDGALFDRLFSKVFSFQSFGVTQP